MVNGLGFDYGGVLVTDSLLDHDRSILSCSLFEVNVICRVYRILHVDPCCMDQPLLTVLVEDFWVYLAIPISAQIQGASSHLLCRLPDREYWSLSEGDLL